MVCSGRLGHRPLRWNGNTPTHSPVRRWIGSPTTATCSPSPGRAIASDTAGRGRSATLGEGVGAPKQPREAPNSNWWSTPRGPWVVYIGRLLTPYSPSSSANAEEPRPARPRLFSLDVEKLRRCARSYCLISPGQRYPPSEGGSMRIDPPGLSCTPWTGVAVLRRWALMVRASG